MAFARCQSPTNTNTRKKGTPVTTKLQTKLYLIIFLIQLMFMILHNFSNTPEFFHLIF